MINKSLNIAMLTLSFYPKQAGMEMMVHNLASQMSSIGNNVYLFAPEPEYKFNEISCNYNIYRFKNVAELKAIFLICHKSIVFDIIYVQGAYHAASIALELRNKIEIPVVLRTHGEDIQIDKTLGYGYRLDTEKNNIILANINSVDYNIAIGSHVLQKVQKLTSQPTGLIYNGVDTEHFFPKKERTLHKALGLKNEVKILLMVGRNVKKKSFHLGIDAFVEVIKTHPYTVLVHIGKEGNAIDLSQYAASKGVSDNFFQLGERNYIEMPSMYNSSDIFLFPSKIETFGNVTVEAMSCGLPCVEFDNKVNKEQIVNGVNGYIVNYGDVNEFAKKIIYILDHFDSIYEQMSMASRKITEKKFSWTVIRNQYVELFNLLAKENNFE